MEENENRAAHKRNSSNPTYRLCERVAGGKAGVNAVERQREGGREGDLHVRKTAMEEDNTCWALSPEM